MIPENRNNKVYFSSKLRDVSPVAYKGVTEILDSYGVGHSLLDGTKDIWARDYMPLQVREDCLMVYDYTPDYLRLYKKYQPLMSNPIEVCRANGIKYKESLGNIRIDGGNVVHCSSKVIMTSKVFEENPSISVRDLTGLLETLFEAQLIVLPWDPREIYGHADGIVRFVDDDTVIMTNYRHFDKKMAARFLNILQSRFKTVHVLEYDVPTPYKDNWAYINYLQTDRVLVVPSFGVPEDEQALSQISMFFPEYLGRIEMADARDLVKGGGCFNCASWTVSE